jgi:hypothetical protein
MAGSPVRTLLLRVVGPALLLLAGLVVVGRTSAMIGNFGLGWDAHAYYVAWDGGLYDAAPGSLDAYNYSPLFAQVVWPLTFLPWPAFAAVFIGAALAGVAWLLRPLPAVVAVAGLMCCAFEIASGNVFWLLAVAAVLGTTRGAPWCAAAFTKVLPCVGPVWFVLRGEWRLLRGFVVAFVLLLAVSVISAPGLWQDWVRFLLDNGGSSPGLAFVPPLRVRLPVAAVLLVYAARTDRAWLLPVVMLLASPVVGTGNLALLAAIPRLVPRRTPTVPGHGRTAGRGRRVTA